MLMLEGLSGSGFQSVLSQYADSEGPISKTVVFDPATDVFIDTRVDAPDQVDFSTIEKETKNLSN
jgi:hypothetical protein